MRRLIALALAVMLLLTCVPFAAADGPVGFTDQSSIRHASAVQMLVDLGLVSGFPDGSFCPEKSITRAEVAKLIAIICTGDEISAGYGAPFGDVSGSWALPFITYCAQRSIIVGSGGMFRPGDDVTAQELAKMLLVILGCDSSRYVGADWAENVNLDAFQMGLYDGLYTSFSRPISRDDACRLILNAMLCYAVSGVDESGNPQYVLDDLMNPQTYLEYRFGLTRYNGILTGNECADLTANGKTLEPGQTRLAGHKIFEVSSSLGLLGRSVDIYMRDGQVIGAPCWSVREVYFTFPHAEDLRMACESGGFSLSDETEYYYNFNSASASILQTMRTDDYITVVDHNADNIFDTVLVITSRPAVVVSASPLVVESGSERLEADAFQADQYFAVGQEVLLSEICGRYYVRPKAE